MKKILVALFLLTQLPLFAQEAMQTNMTQDNFVLKTNPFVLIAGPLFPFSSQYGMTGEFVHGVNQSSQISAAYLGKGILLDALLSAPGVAINIDEWVFQGYRVQISHRFYLFRDVGKGKLAPNGLYVGPHTSLASMKISDPFFNQFQTYIRGTEFNANLLIGLQFNLYGWYFDANIGLGYKNNFWQETQGSQTVSIPLSDLGYGNYYRSNFKVHVGFETGFSF